MALKHVVFDFNGTLLDDVALAVWCDNQIFTQADLAPISVETYQQHLQVPLENYYRALGIDASKLPFSDINQRFLHLFNNNLHRAALRPGTLGVLEALQDMGLGLSVLSASYEETVQAQCEALGLSKYMQRVTGLLDTDAGHKTERGQQHLQMLGLSPEEVLLVGDTFSDVALSEHLGCDCVLMEGGHVSTDRLQAAGLPIVTGMPELLALIRNL